MKLNFGVCYAKCANNFSLRPKEDAAISSGTSVNEIYRRSVAYAFDVINSFNPQDIYESTLMQQAQQNRWSLFSISTKGFSSSWQMEAEEMEWAASSYSSKNQSSNRRVSGILSALKQQEVICQSSNPKWLLTFLSLENLYVCVYGPAVKLLDELYVSNLSWYDDFDYCFKFILTMKMYLPFCHSSSQFVLNPFILEFLIVASNHSLATVERVICRL